MRGRGHLAVQLKVEVVRTREAADWGLVCRCRGPSRSRCAVNAAPHVQGAALLRGCWRE